MTHDQKVAQLVALTARLCTTHHWRNQLHVAAPMTRAHLNEHVAGTARIGLCPITPGTSTVQVALLDLDSHRGDTPWPEMLRAAQFVRFALEEEGMRPTLWRSSGGRGIHVYITFGLAQEARDVRLALTDTLELCGFASGTKGVAQHEIEVFPKQDDVPLTGCGSMWVLPYAGKSEQL